MARASGTSSVPASEAVPPQPAARPGDAGRRWIRPAFVGVILIAAFVVSQTCQKSQIRVTKDGAIATAKRQVDFNPTRTQIRLLRQGINSKPFWIVSLSIPTTGAPTTNQEFKELAVIRIDANTGKVADVKVQR